jgi:ATP-binding cassette subfamily B protein
MILSKKFPNYKQYDTMDCGPACLKIIAGYYGKHLSLDYLRSICHTNRSGTPLISLIEAAQKIGLQSEGVSIGFQDLATTVQLPCIIFWQRKHFVVVYKITDAKVFVSDPACGLLTYKRDEFINYWMEDASKGIAMLVEPKPAFYSLSEGVGVSKGFSFLWKHLRPHRKLVGQLIAALLLASGLQFFFPFLTQKLVDKGIKDHDLHFIYLVSLAQLFVFLGRTTMEILRNYVMVHLSSRLNIGMLSQFFFKLMRLPLGFFDNKFMGDILQRIADHSRIEQFLTAGTLNFIFSFLSLFVFSIVLYSYNPVIFAWFAAGSLLYFIWIKLFMKQRAGLDYKRFSQLSQAQEKNIELITGMQEIKLQGLEDHLHGQWKDLQHNLYQINRKTIALKQWQTGGASVINEVKNIFIISLAAKLVVHESLTLGAMLSISYIIGQLNGPILQLIDFFQSWQDASLSLNRVCEIHDRPNEDGNGGDNIAVIPSGDICLENFSFRYDKHGSTSFILNNIHLVIPEGKITAIVGSSGSGKTTLMKMLLRFYEPDKGRIRIGSADLAGISLSQWRANCGVVMQEGFLFNDTIAGNIAVGHKEIDREKLLRAAKVANIHEFIEQLPLGYDTMIGRSGMALSTGQKQRILIARAVFKDPSVLFFDEATSALDARNERIIVDNLNKFFRGKTVVIIAHRLSTVKNADKIIVLEKGRVTEAGNHRQLIEEKGFYFNLVKNQLELN